jgi:phospholipid transport system substrate-binding protein
MTNALVLKSWRRPVLMLSTILLVLVFLAALTRGSLAGDDEDAAQFVRSFGDQAIAMLSDPALGPADREREFRHLLTDGFHLELIGRFVLGRHWRRASDEERAEFQRLFEDYVVASYAQQLANYAGEQLVIQRGQVKGERGALVSSQITRPQGDPIQVEWRLRRAGEGWRIIDVVVEGISMAVTHRSEFSSVIGSHGGRIDGLLEVLRGKTAPAETHASAGTVDTL